MILERKFNIRLPVYDNIIQNILNIEEFIYNSLKQKYLYKPLKRYIPIEILNFSYFYPKKNIERTENSRQFVIELYVHFKCLRIQVNEILTNLTLDKHNKFEEFYLLYKDYNPYIKIIAIELNTNQTYSSTNNSCKVLKTEIIERKDYTTINCIVEKVSYPYIHFFKPVYITNYNIEIIPKDFKFHITSSSKSQSMTIDELYELIKRMKYEEVKMTFEQHKIKIEENTGEKIVSINDPSHFDTIIIELYNLTLIK